MLSLRGLVEFSRKMLSDSEQSYLCHRLQLAYNCNLLEDLPKVDGSYALYLRAEREIHFSMYASTNEVRAALADFLGVCQVTDDDQPLDWKARRTWMPLVTAGQKPVFLEASESLARLLAADFDPRHEVCLPAEAKAQVQVTNRTAAQVLSSQFAAHRLTFNVTASETSLVVLAQCFYPTWRAYVDGVPVRLWRANHAFQALQVPPGRHQVTLRYEDRAFQIGAAISSLALLGWAAGQRHWRTKE
jgi:hypothetical protein